MLTRELEATSLGAVLKTALDAVVVMRMDGTVAGWNDVAERTFGWSYAAALGKRMSDLIIPLRFREMHERGLVHYLETGEGPVLDTHIEIFALHRAGHEIPVELSITRTSQFGEPVFLGFLRDITERRDAERRQKLMIDELNHRVKNVLGVVSGVAHQTVRASSTLADFGPAFMGRLESMGRAYEMLTAGVWERASLRALAESLLATFSGAEGRASIDGADVALLPRQFLSLSMILHELLTNAVKYGALADDGGHIALGWEVVDRTLTLRWTESCAQPVAAPARSGFGSRMIALSVKHELNGEARSTWLANGLDFTLTFRIE